MAVLRFGGQEFNVRLAEEGHKPNVNNHSAAPAKPTARATLDPLFEQYRGWLLSIAINHGAQYHDAEDLVQDTYLKALKSFSTLRHPERITG